jgi:uncharacterized membrane protein (DUF485 family)
MHRQPDIDWDAVMADPRFIRLHRRKQAFLTLLMLFSLAYYLALPVAAAWFRPVFARQVWGPVNLGLLFALSEFLVAGVVAWVYARRAGSEFDGLAREITARYQSGESVGPVGETMP